MLVTLKSRGGVGGGCYVVMVSRSRGDGGRWQWERRTSEGALWQKPSETVLTGGKLRCL